MKPKFASIFSGCGGFDIGFIQAGYNCTGAFDIDSTAIEVHRSNLRSNAITCDLRIPLPHNDALDNLDVLLAGPPCQGFSVAGRRDISDPRNELLLTAGHIAVSVKPRVFIAENVVGVLSGAQRKYWDSLRYILRTGGYKTGDVICEGTTMGVPQRRRRVLMIAWRCHRDVDLKFPHKDGGTIRTALANLSRVTNHRKKILPSTSHMGLIANHIKPGQKLSNVRNGPSAVHTWDIPEVFGPTSPFEKQVLECLLRLRRQNRVRDVGEADPVSAELISTNIGGHATSALHSLELKGYIRRVGELYDLTHTYNGKYRRPQMDQPSPTVDTRFGDPRYFLHPKENRGFTVREAARLQGFPDTFSFLGSEATQFRLIGNAVPPPLAKCVALFIKRVLL